MAMTNGEAVAVPEPSRRRSSVNLYVIMSVHEPTRRGAVKKLTGR